MAPDTSAVFFSSRLVYAMVSAAFCISLGIFALWRNPHHRLNLTFALLNFSNAGMQLAGLAHAFVAFGYLPHGVGLVLYRLIFQLSIIGIIHYILAFVQELVGVAEERIPTMVRRSFIVFAVVAGILSFTPLVIKDVVATHVRQMPSTEVIGPAYPFFMLMVITGFLVLVGFVVHYLKQASGSKKNQLKYVLSGLILAILAFGAKYYSLRYSEIAGVYFLMQLGITFIFAYMIFQSRLFDFNIWMRRAAVYSGTYAALLSLPFVMQAKWPVLPEAIRESFWTLPILGMGYALLCLTVPTLMTYLRDKAEEARWFQLRSQLAFITETSERLADEHNNSINQIAARTAETLNEFYFAKLKQPPKFILVALIGQDEKLATAIRPEIEIEPFILHKFIENMSKTPMLAMGGPFTDADVNQLLMKNDELADENSVSTIHKYLIENEIEICCPCFHDGRLYGAVLFGAKIKGIFFPEELSSLQIAATNVATAVRKSELLERSQSLQELDFLKKELIANITHEFKSPLANVENAITILRRDQAKGLVEPEKMERYLKMIESNAQRLTVFIQNLLEVAKIEQPEVGLETSPCHLRGLLESCCSAQEATALQKEITLSLVPEDDLVVEIDKGKMMQVFSNLIGNAVKFTEQGGVTVHMKKINQKARVEIRDTGPGIDPQFLTAIFDRFFQVPNGASKAKGTGLGLAIAKGWTEAHGGRIWASSDGIGKGACFTVELPLGNNG